MMGGWRAACFGGSDYYCQLVLPRQGYTCSVTGSIESLKLARAGDAVALLFNGTNETSGYQSNR